MADDKTSDETVRTTPQGVTVNFDLDGTRTAFQPLAPEGTPSRTAGTGSSVAEPTANHVALPVGYQLHEYTIERILGVGGFGITYLARDNNLQCQVAIKEYLPNDLAVRMSGQSVMPRTDSDTHGYQIGLERFLAETRVLAGFRHPNIVRVNRFFETNRTAYMVMDYEHGQSLRDWLSNHNPVDEAILKRMFLPLLDGLEVVHKGGIVHRDIKPANIYVRDSDGSLVLLDFGAARQTTGAASKSLTSIITPGYAPFEQYHARGSQGPWTDLYALAGVLYWMVTGQKPLEAPTRVKNDTMPPAIEAGNGRFSPGFLAAIDWALTVDEDIRPRSVAEFRPVLLGEAPIPQRSSAVPPAPTFIKPTPKTPLMKIAVVGVAVAAVAVLGFFSLNKSSQPEAVPPSSSTTPPPPQGLADSGTSTAPPAAVPVKPARDKVQAGLAKNKPNAEASGAVAYLLFEIVPAGERADIIVDGKKIGSAPPLRELKVAAGKHRIEIRGEKPPNVYHYWVDLDSGEKKKLWAKFASEL